MMRFGLKNFLHCLKISTKTLLHYRHSTDGEISLVRTASCLLIVTYTPHRKLYTNVHMSQSIPQDIITW